MIGPGHSVRDVCGVLVRKFLSDKILTITKKTEHHKLTAGIASKIKKSYKLGGVLKSSKLPFNKHESDQECLIYSTVTK